MLDVKKLIVGFLILAAGASSSALILSSVTTSTAGANNAVNQTAQMNAAADGTPSNSAFAAADGTAGANGAIDPTDAAQMSTTTAAQLANPENLTNVLADSFLNNVAAMNPDSEAQTDANGDVTVTPPDNQAILQQFSGDPAFANLQIPNWDIEAATQKITIQANYSKADVDNYSKSMGNIFDKYVQSTNLANILQGDDPTSAGYAATNIASALQAIAALPTPAPLVNLQKSMVKLLVYEKNYLALGTNVSSDPVKTYLVNQAEKAKFDAAAQDLQSQWEKLTGEPLSLNANNNGIVALLGRLVGIQTANAQVTVPVTDLGSIGATHAQTAMQLKDYIEAYIMNVTTQILKNLLTALVQQKVLNWIQGSGAPRFIQNWGSTIVNSYAAAATGYLNSNFQCVPSFMLPSLKVLLVSPNLPGNNNACAAQFNSQLGNNLTNFFGHFENGGFNSYFSLFQPNGNAFGAIITLQDGATAAASVAQQATLGKITAAQGYNGSENCTDNPLEYVQGKYLPDGSHYVCQDNNNGSTYHPTIGSDGSVTCGSNQSLTTAANGNLCASGSTPQITTPGNVANQAMGTALDSTPKLIAGSYEISGLFAAFISSLLNTLAQSAINYTNQAVQGALQPSDSGVTGVPANFASSTIQQTVDNPVGEPGVTCNADNPDPILDPTNPQVTVNFQAIGGAQTQDGFPPTYTWTSSSGGSTTGNIFSENYTAVGTYDVTVTASTDNSASTCTVVVTNPQTSDTTTCGGTTPGTCPNPTQSCVPNTTGGTTTFSCQ